MSQGFCGGAQAFWSGDAWGTTAPIVGTTSIGLIRGSVLLRRGMVRGSGAIDMVTFTGGPRSLTWPHGGSRALLDSNLSTTFIHTVTLCRIRP